MNDNKNKFEEYKKINIEHKTVGGVDIGVIGYKIADDGDFYMDSNTKEIYPTEKIEDIKNKEKYQEYFDYDVDSLKNIKFEDLEITPAKIVDRNTIVKGKINVKKIENKDDLQNENTNMPREKEEWESYEKYEDYLKKFYDEKGIDPGVAGKFGGVNVPFRGKYPHELANPNDEYYSNMLQHFNKKYANMIKNAGGEDTSVKPVTEDTEKKYIPGTKIAMPREKYDDETIEDYEQYLYDHYKPYGLVDENVIYFSGTNIPIPRRPYPHEKDFLEKDSYYSQMLNYYSEKYKNQTTNEYGYTGPVKEGEQLAVVEPKEEHLVPIKDEEIVDDNTNNDTLDDEVHEVKGIRKAFKWIKEHRKLIIAAIGIASLVAAFVPGVAPAVMVANSKLWTYAPAFGKTILHGANSMLSMLCGAKEVDVGLWAIKGVLLNSSTAMAHVSIIKALATSATALAGSAAIVNTISYTIKSIKEKIKKSINKNKNKEKVETEELEKDNGNENEKDKSLEEDVELTEDEEKISNIQKVKQKYNDIKESIKNRNQPTIIEPKNEGDSRIIIEASVPPMPQPEEFDNDALYNKAVNEWFKNYKDKVTIEPYEEQMGGKSK